MIGLCPFQMWRSLVHATVETTLKFRVPENEPEKFVESLITQQYISRFGWNLVGLCILSLVMNADTSSGNAAIIATFLSLICY